MLLAPGPSFAPEGGLDRYLRIPYTVAVQDLEEAVRRIAAAWRVVSAAAPVSRPPRDRRTGVLVA